MIPFEENQKKPFALAPRKQTYYAEAMHWRIWGYHSFLESDEAVVLAYRHQSGAMIATQAGGVLLCVSLLSYAWYYFLPEPWNWGGVVLLALGVIRTLWRLRCWYMKALLITNKGILYVDWEYFFYRRQTRVGYEIIDSIEIEQLGPRAVIFNYGTVRFRSASGGDITLERVQSPKSLVEKVEYERQKFMNEKGITDEQAIKDVLVGIAGKQKNPKSAPVATLKSRTISTSTVIVEKELDDNGGLEIDLGDPQN